MTMICVNVSSSDRFSAADSDNNFSVMVPPANDILLCRVADGTSVGNITVILMSLEFVRSVGHRSGGHHGACVKSSKKQSKVVGGTRYDDFGFHVGIGIYFGGQKSSAVVS